MLLKHMHISTIYLRILGIFHLFILYRACLNKMITVLKYSVKCIHTWYTVVCVRNVRGSEVYSLTVIWNEETTFLLQLKHKLTIYMCVHVHVYSLTGKFLLWINFLKTQLT